MSGTVDALATPAVLVDGDVLAGNVTRMAAHARALGVALRPHVKTHKSVAIARMQRDAGADGFTVATLREAEALVAAGLGDDLLLASAPVGSWRAERLRALRAATRVTLLVDGPGAARAAGAGARCLWEVDPGTGRSGTPPGAPTADAASRAVAETGIELVGFLSFPGHAYAAGDAAALDRAVADERDAMAQTAQAAREAGLADGVRSGGTTPSSWRMRERGPITELRPGNYVFHDATQVALGVATLAQCALRVLATVVSRPTPDRVIVDAGSKALGRELMTTRTPGFGLLLREGLDPLPITALYEEHGIVEAPAGTAGLPAVGDRVELVPNHSCVTANLHDAYVVRRGHEIVDVVAVDARGWGPYR